MTDIEDAINSAMKRWFEGQIAAYNHAIKIVANEDNEDDIIARLETNRNTAHKSLRQREDEG